MTCIGPPDRLQFPGLGQCGNFITHRPHLSMYPYRDIAFPLYPQSNPAKYADQFRHTDGKVHYSPSHTPVSLVWNYSRPYQISVACQPQNCPP